MKGRWDNMKFKKTLIIMTLVLFPVISFASPESRGIMTKTNLDKKVTREEVASISIRFAGKTDQKSQGPSRFIDVSGWSKEDIDLSDSLGYMKGISDIEFKPKANVRYIDFMTVLMRTMGYVDGVDLQNYPSGYYQKALDIGLASIYIGPSTEITRKVAYETLEKALEIRGDKESPVKDPSPNENVKDSQKPSISIKEFNTSLVPLLKGQLENFSSDYKLVLRTSKGKDIKEVTVDERGEFSDGNFPIDSLSKLFGYELVIKDRNGKIILQKTLE